MNFFLCPPFDVSVRSALPYLKLKEYINKFLLDQAKKEIE